MPQNFAEGMSQDTIDACVELLNHHVASSIDLTLAVKQAHWNCKGRGFIGFHELLDDVAERMRERTDTMAERVVVMGGLAAGTTQVAEAKTILAPYPTDLVDLQEHVRELVQRFKTFGASVREAIAKADEAGSEDVADLFTEVSRGVDKDAWFIGANAASN